MERFIHNLSYFISPFPHNRGPRPPKRRLGGNHPDRNRSLDQFEYVCLRSVRSFPFVGHVMASSFHKQTKPLTFSSFLFSIPTVKLIVSELPISGSLPTELGRCTALSEWIPVPLQSTECNVSPWNSLVSL